MSDSASTSVSDPFCELGEVVAVRELECESARGVEQRDVGCGCGVALGTLILGAFLAALRAFVRSASRFSRVPKSVFPLSSSERRPESRRSDSMRPRRFSRPSMYFALRQGPRVSRQALLSDTASSHCVSSGSSNIPFGWVSFLLHLREDTLGLVIDTVGAFGHLAIALDFFLPTHVACLEWGTRVSYRARLIHTQRGILVQFSVASHHWRHLPPSDSNHRRTTTPRGH